MTAMDNDKIIAGLPIVKWLSQQRNARGGFGSTQVRSTLLMRMSIVTSNCFLKYTRVLITIL